jgi:hypothetical protein
MYEETHLSDPERDDVPAPFFSRWNIERGKVKEETHEVAFMGSEGWVTVYDMTKLEKVYPHWFRIVRAYCRRRNQHELRMKSVNLFLIYGDSNEMTSSWEDLLENHCYIKEICTEKEFKDAFEGMKAHCFVECVEVWT